MPRVCLTRSRPSSGFLTPSTVCSPSGLADTLGPLPLMGFTRPSVLSDGWAVVTLRCRLRSLVRGALQPRILRKTRSKAPQPQKHLSPSALVPRPWFQDQGRPFEAHVSRTVTGAFAPAFPSRA
jgi:hypothetical protein